jgi:hypothetical protein
MPLTLRSEDDFYYIFRLLIERASTIPLVRLKLILENVCFSMIVNKNLRVEGDSLNIIPELQRVGDLHCH